MKIYISVDIEGISGVTNWGFTHEGGYNYERARRFMTEEVNAVIRGAKKAGAEEILVNDSHGPMTSILIEELDEDVVLISGNKKILGMMEGIDNTFDAVMLIGYHGRHNTSGILAHSYNGSVVSEIKLNGRVVGEFEFNSLLAGYFKVPVVMTSGDNILTSQAKEFNKSIEAVEVKKAHSRYVGECIQPKRVYKMLESSAEKAIYNKLVEPNILDDEIELEIAFMDSGMAEGTLCIPGVQLIEPNRIKYKAKDIMEAYKIRSGLITLAGAWMR